MPVELSVSLIFDCIQRKISLQSGVDELLNNMENPDICRNWVENVKSCGVEV